MQHLWALMVRIFASSKGDGQFHYRYTWRLPAAHHQLKMYKIPSAIKLISDLDPFYEQPSHHWNICSMFTGADEERQVWHNLLSSYLQRCSTLLDLYLSTHLSKAMHHKLLTGLPLCPGISMRFEWPSKSRKVAKKVGPLSDVLFPFKVLFAWGSTTKYSVNAFGGPLLIFKMAAPHFINVLPWSAPMLLCTYSKNKTVLNLLSYSCNSSVVPHFQKLFNSQYSRMLVTNYLQSFTMISF